jgi:Raf kinase inhibitor-like YbhB/YbcL family protein
MPQAPDVPTRKVTLPVPLEKPRSLALGSPAFRDGEPIPAEVSCQGDDVSPPLRVGGTPPGTRALALVCDDPDAPGGTFTHWLAWNLPPETTELPRGADVRRLGATTAENGFGRPGYGGPCPPRGQTHRYFFRVFALDRPLDLPATASADDVWRAVAAHVLAWGEIMGTFRKA